MKVLSKYTKINKERSYLESGKDTRKSWKLSPSLRLESVKLTYSLYMTIAISYKCTTQLSKFQSSHSANPCNISALVDQ